MLQIEHYFIDYYRDRDPLINQLTIDDLRESRLYLVDPAPILGRRAPAHLRPDEEL